MPDLGSEVMAEALAQRALVKPVYTIPIIPLSSSNQYRHQDHLDMKDYKKVSACVKGTQAELRSSARRTFACSVEPKKMTAASSAGARDKNWRGCCVVVNLVPT